MKIRSLIQDKKELIPVDVELTLLPGLPGIHFLGLPDQHLKESTARIKSAIKQAGFEFPTGSQILVNLRPSNIRKNSKGLDLAVAAAYLWETDQVPKPLLDSDFFVYGELTLSGEVLEPEDLVEDFLKEKSVVLTGEPNLKRAAPFRRQVISHLQELSNPQEKLPESALEKPIRPTAEVEFFSERQAKLIRILSAGEHSCLFAGPSGSGKTTVAKSLAAFLRPPKIASYRQMKRIHRHFGEDLSWRPIVKPHHTTPLMAMVGGGSVPFAGEITRAHGGVLILDELLEFQSSVQEALREPFEEKKIRVVRQGKFQDYPAQMQILGTTNLCPCGDWTPRGKKGFGRCRFSKIRCESYSQRLSGPFVDRFEMLEFTEKLKDPVVSAAQILSDLEKVFEFQNQQKRPEAGLTLQDLIATVRPQVLSLLPVSFSSHRRKISTLRVARTLADIDGSTIVEAHHLDEALNWTHLPFERLKRWDFG